MEIERRRQPRVPLQSTVYLWRPGDETPRRARVFNLNDEGFYCVADAPFTVGEEIDCDFIIPVESSGVRDEAMVLHWRATVLRVETSGRGGACGIACLVKHSAVVHVGAETGPAS